MEQTPKHVPHADAMSPAPNGRRANGDVERSFEALYESHRKELHGHAAAILRSPHLAEEVVQQAFTNTYAALERGTEIHNPRGWLHRCVHNLCADRLRKEAPLPIDHALEVSAPHSAATAAELRDRCRAVDDAVRGMPEHWSSVFLLAELRGLSYKEIGDELGSSVSTVRDMLFRARTVVREAVRRAEELLVAPIAGTYRALAGRSPGGHESVAAKGSHDGESSAIAQWISLPRRLATSAGDAVQLAVQPTIAAVATGVTLVAPQAPVADRTDPALIQVAAPVAQVQSERPPKRSASRPAHPRPVRIAPVASGRRAAPPRRKRPGNAGATGTAGTAAARSPGNGSTEMATTARSCLGSNAAPDRPRLQPWERDRHREIALARERERGPGGQAAMSERRGASSRPVTEDPADCRALARERERERLAAERERLAAERAAREDELLRERRAEEQRREDGHEIVEVQEDHDEHPAAHEEPAHPDEEGGHGEEADRDGHDATPADEPAAPKDDSHHDSDSGGDAHQGESGTPGS